MVTDQNGVATATLKGTDPGNPRGYIDGQVYAVFYQLDNVPPVTFAPPAPPTPLLGVNPYNFVSVRIYNSFKVEGKPTWVKDIEPIFTLYANLFPLMSRRLINLADYNEVAERRQLLRFSFALPVSSPGYMPVTRDLSRDKLQAILEWLDTEGPDGLPLFE